MIYSCNMLAISQNSCYCSAELSYMEAWSVSGSTEHPWSLTTVMLRNCSATGTTAFQRLYHFNSLPLIDLSRKKSRLRYWWCFLVNLQ